MADTKDVIRAAMASAEGGNTSSDSGETENTTSEVETTETETETTETETAENADEGSEESEAETEGESAGEQAETSDSNSEHEEEAQGDPFATEHGLKEKDGQGRTNRIPYPAVKRIVGNAERKLYKAITGEDLPKDGVLSDAVNKFKTSISERDTRVRGYEERLELVAQGEDVMLNHPERMLEILPTLNPKYAELLAPKQVEATSDMPTPDLDLGEGKGKTYSTAGLQKLLDWHAGAVTKRVLSESNKQFKPIMDERASREYKEKVIIPALRRKVEYARANWKGFKDWEVEIDGELAKDKKIGLEDAYIRVRDRKHEEEIIKLKTDAEKARKKVLADMKKAPKSTSTTTNTTVKKAENSGERTSADVIREQLRKKGLIK